MFKKNKKFTFNENNVKDKVIVDNLSSYGQNYECEKFITYKNVDSKNVLIEVKDLKKSFDTKHVLRGISLNFHENEKIAILGGNGAGKTTFVEILAGLNKPSSGEIKYNYNYTNSFQEKIGIQFQDSNFPKGINVKDIIDFIYDIFKSELSKDELKALIRIFGVEDIYNKKAASLSGGESQRINCVLSILHKPKFLILDELSTGLDVTIKNKIKKFIKEFANANGMSTLLISHDVEEIKYLAERIIIFKDGEVNVDAKLSDINKKFGDLEKCLEYYIR